jgi:site-specific recombinase XerD
MLERFRVHLEQFRYNRDGIPSHISAARQFLAYLTEQGTSIDEAGASHLDAFLETKLEQYRNRHDCLPRHPIKWRSTYTGPIHRLLRMLQPQWPPAETPANDCERFQFEVRDGYGRWLTEVQGLSQETLRKNGDAARLFLRWLGERADRESLGRLSVFDLDGYLEWRMQRLRRATRSGVSACLRSFLRYLKLAGFIPRDLSTAVAGPTLYKFEEIPRAFTAQQIEKLLEVTRRDLSPAGLRDYAMLMLLATYGLRAGEVVRLRVEDIDWRGERLRVRQSKTGVESLLPLVAPVGEALLKYLQHGRAKTDEREVFLRVHAPHGPFDRGGAVDTVINRRLNEAGIDVKGRRHGSHAFRFARAASLLQASVPLKLIGDLLGHRTASSTAIYLRLTTDGLRAISLEVPPKA